MKRILALVLLLSCSMVSCKTMPSVLEYETHTIDQAVMAWTDAYNRDQIGQLRLLVHPSRVGHFDVDKKALRQKLKVWRIDRFLVGSEVVVNDEFPGREVTLHYHDGSRVQPRTGVFVQAQERWWAWSY